MEIKNVTEDELFDAMYKTNQIFDGNIEWNRMEPLNKAGTRWRVTLRVRDSHGPGARLSQGLTSRGNRRHMISACWHVHGVFFEMLPAQAVIRTAHGTTYPGDYWEDFNIGSRMYPLAYSDACECQDYPALMNEILEVRFGSPERVN